MKENLDRKKKCRTLETTGGKVGESDTCILWIDAPDYVSNDGHLPIYVHLNYVSYKNPETGDCAELEIIFPRDYEILGWCPAGTFLPHGEKVPL